ncbi:MAG: signal peptidase I [Candidatus Paceibacterota bacterium]|jgi:signal peptidase I
MELKEFVTFLLDSLKILLIALAIVIPIRMLLFQPFVVKGDSMEPSYHSGDYLIIDELSYKLRDPQRGEVIVFKYPLNTSLKYIKRIIALPNETIELKNGEVYVSRAGSQPTKIDENLYINDKTREAWKNMIDYSSLTLKSNEYFVMGDNRNFSSDSRVWGVLPANDITGRVLLRISPLEVLMNTMNSVNSSN